MRLGSTNLHCHQSKCCKSARNSKPNILKRVETELEAAVVVLHKVGGGAGINFNYLNELSVTVTVTT
jgi:hypothetical protein